MPITLEQFEQGDVENSTFRHADHVRIGYELLAGNEFETALVRFARGLRRIATAGGHPEKFHATMTVAFMSAIAERRLRHPELDWETFSARFPELMNRTLLDRWYAPSQLRSDQARRTFVLPDVPGLHPALNGPRLDGVERVT